MLSRYFSLEELTFSEFAIRNHIDNTPPADVLENLKVLASRADRVRSLLALPIYVSSGYRCEKLNAAIGGSKTSAHMKGLAMDFTCPAYGSPEKVFDLLMQNMGMVDFDQIINEFGRWIHFGISLGKGRKQYLTYDGKQYTRVA